jgi:transcription elongation factor GreA
MGRGFIGKNKGEFVEIKTPSGDKNFEITDVQYI